MLLINNDSLSANKGAEKKKTNKILWALILVDNQ